MADSDTTLFADELAIEQALTNVVHNAIKFARSKATLWIDTTPTLLTICVHDDGPGFEASDDMRTIEANFAISTAENIEGLGLGVAIAKRIMNNHRGTLSVTRLNEPGTLVKMHLRGRQNRRLQPSEALQQGNLASTQ